MIQDNHRLVQVLPFKRKPAGPQGFSVSNDNLMESVQPVENEENLMSTSLLCTSGVGVETVPLDRSSFETVREIVEKAGEMKQNRFWYCFRRCSLSFMKVTVSTFGPENFRRN